MVLVLVGKTFGEHLMISNQPLHSPWTSDQRRWMRRFIIVFAPTPWIIFPAIMLAGVLWPAANGILTALGVICGLIIPFCVVIFVGRLLAVDECDRFTFRWSWMSIVWFALACGGLVSSVLQD